MKNDDDGVQPPLRLVPPPLSPVESQAACVAILRQELSRAEVGAYNEIAILGLKPDGSYYITSRVNNSVAFLGLAEVLKAMLFQRLAIQPEPPPRG